VLRRVIAVTSVFALGVVTFALIANGGDERAAPGVSSPAIVVDDVRGLPATVAALPNTDAEAFRSLMGELRGTPVVVNLWASWCEPCKVEMPRLAAAASRHPGVQFVGVDTLDSREGAEAFIAEFSVPFPSLFDPEGTVRTELEGFGLPVTVFFDADGEQFAKVEGELSQSDLDEGLTAIDP
jgi:cytochrome c biogenesis protein CcmG, thiol:disulfide interchange protein DsbE